MPPSPRTSIAERPRRGQRLPAAVLGCVLAGFVLLPFDAALVLRLAEPAVFHEPAARQRAAAVSGLRLRGDLRRTVSLSEFFAHGTGTVTVVALIWVLHPAGRGRLPSLIGTVVVAGVAATLVKQIIARTRPMAFDFREGILATFQPPGAGVTVAHQVLSTPSAHAATVVALSLVLGRLYPRGRALFPILAAVACLQRITSGAHFPSDVCWGASLGCAAAYVIGPAGRQEEAAEVAGRVSPALSSATAESTAVIPPSRAA